MLITTISFPGNCDEAIAFYKEAVGAKVKDIAYFRDAPPNHGMDESLPPDFVMHSEVLISGTVVAMTDGAQAKPSGDNYSFMLSCNSAEEATDVFNKFAEGGKVISPLEPQFWASLWGDVEDRFGVVWGIYVD